MQTMHQENFRSRTLYDKNCTVREDCENVFTDLEFRICTKIPIMKSRSPYVKCDLSNHFLSDL